MFEKDLEFDKDFTDKVASGELLPPEGYKLSEDKTKMIPKTEEEILGDDWDSSLERKCEYRDYLEWDIANMERYLAETDWYISRKAETGKDIPSDVIETRLFYRDRISLFRDKLKKVEF